MVQEHIERLRRQRDSDMRKAWDSTHPLVGMGMPGLVKGWYSMQARYTNRKLVQLRRTLGHYPESTAARRTNLQGRTIA